MDFRKVFSLKCLGLALAASMEDGAVVTQPLFSYGVWQPAVQSCTILESSFKFDTAHKSVFFSVTWATVDSASEGFIILYN